MSKLVVTKQRFVVQELALPKANAGDNAIVFLGRSESNDVCLPSLRVSKRHASIQQRGTHAYLTDLGSTNGTFLNGERVPSYREVELFNGDEITIEPYTIRCELPHVRPDAAPQPTGTPPRASTETDRDAKTIRAGGGRYEADMLVVLERGEAVQVLSLGDGNVTIGRATTDTFRVESGGPVRTHLRVFRAGDAYYAAVVCDEIVATVDGNLITRQSGPVRLDHGASIELAGYTFQAVLGTQIGGGAGPTKKKPRRRTARAADPFADLALGAAPRSAGPTPTPVPSPTQHPRQPPPTQRRRRHDTEMLLRGAGDLLEELGLDLAPGALGTPPIPVEGAADATAPRPAPQPEAPTIAETPPPLSGATASPQFEANGEEKEHEASETILVTDTLVAPRRRGVLFALASLLFLALMALIALLARPQTRDPLLAALGISSNTQKPSLAADRIRAPRALQPQTAPSTDDTARALEPTSLPTQPPPPPETPARKPRAASPPTDGTELAAPPDARITEQPPPAPTTTQQERPQDADLAQSTDQAARPTENGSSTADTEPLVPVVETPKPSTPSDQAPPTTKTPLSSTVAPVAEASAPPAPAPPDAASAANDARTENEHETQVADSGAENEPESERRAGLVFARAEAIEATLRAAIDAAPTKRALARLLEAQQWVVDLVSRAPHAAESRAIDPIEAARRAHEALQRALEAKKKERAGATSR